jgi:hypothetical protein
MNAFSKHQPTYRCFALINSTLSKKLEIVTGYRVGAKSNPANGTE